MIFPGNARCRLAYLIRPTCCTCNMCGLLFIFTEVAMSTGLRFTLEVDGLPPDAFAVVSFHLNQSLSSLFSLDLSLVSQQFLSLEFAQVLDKMAYLTIWQGDEVQRRVKGVVTWFELG
ncbi:VgrE protein, partial [Escherichia coli B921]